MVNRKDFRPSSTTYQMTDKDRAKIRGTSKIEKVMSEYHEGTLKTSTGKKVTKKKQAVAIALSEQRAYEKKHKKVKL